MHGRDALALCAGPVDGFLDRAEGRAPADNQQIAAVFAVNLGRFQRCGKRRQFAAAHVHAFLVGGRVVGDLAVPVVREPGQDVLAAAHARYRPIRQAGLLVPVIGRHVPVPGRLVYRRGEPLLGDLRPFDRLHARCEIGVGQDDDRTAERLGQLARHLHEVETLRYRGGRDDDLGRVARRTVQARQQITLFDLRRQTGGGAATLHVDDDQRHLRHDGEADHLGLQRHAGAGRNRAGRLAGVGRADREADGGDLVFGLVHEAAGQRIVVGQVVRRGRRRRDRIHRYQFDAGGHDAKPDRRVAVYDDRRRQPRILGGGYLELVVEIVTRERVAGIEQIVIDLYDLVALAAEDLRDLVLRLVDVAVVDPAEHAQYEHVLALARVPDQLQALLLDRQFMHDETALVEVGQRFAILVANLLVRVLRPHVLEQDDRAFAVGAVG